MAGAYSTVRAGLVLSTSGKPLILLLPGMFSFGVNAALDFKSAVAGSGARKLLEALRVDGFLEGQPSCFEVGRFLLLRKWSRCESAGARQPGTDHGSLSDLREPGLPALVAPCHNIKPKNNWEHNVVIPSSGPSRK